MELFLCYDGRLIDYSVLKIFVHIMIVLKTKSRQNNAILKLLSIVSNGEKIQAQKCSNN